MRYLTCRLRGVGNAGRNLIVKRLIVTFGYLTVYVSPRKEMEDG